ncbi:MAG: ACT domain-containing protein [Thermoplasmatota archaeon]
MVAWGPGLQLLHVDVPDEPGELAQLARALADRGVNLHGLMVTPSGIDLLLRNLDVAQSVLRAAGYTFATQAVHEVVLDDRPGALAEMCEKLAANQVNIVCALGLSNGPNGRIYVTVNEESRAAPILDNASHGPVVLHGRIGRIPPPGV